MYNCLFFAEGKINLDNDQSLNYNTFNIGTIDNKATSWKLLERAKRIII